MSAAPLAQIKPTTRIELVNVTPELAEFWLTQNSANRNVRREVWKAYARDMAAGAWKVTAETIKMSPAGRLLDGQHRLQAVVASGVTVPMFVAYAPENIGRYTATHAEITAWVDEHPAVFDAATLINGLQNRIKGCRPSVALYTLLMLEQIDYDQAHDFWLSVADQVGDYPGDPVVALARRFSEAYREREQLTHSAQLSMIYRAWNNRRGNKPMRIVRVNSPGTAGGLIPVPVPR